MVFKWMFFDSEVWSGTNKSDLKELDVIDHSILRLITGAQSKVPTEMFYLELGQIPIKSVIAVRRILYLHNIFKRHKTELIRRVYCAMKNETAKGDCIELVANDMKDINLDLSDEENSQFSKKDFKSLIKKIE